MAFFSGRKQEDKNNLFFNSNPQLRTEAILDFEKIDYPKLNRLIFEATNEARKAEQLPALQYSLALEKAAFEHSQNMARGGYLSHKGREVGKQKLSERLALVGIPKSLLAENIATTFGGSNTAFNRFKKNYPPEPPTPYSYEEIAETVVKQWMRSPGHRANILNPNLAYLGCGAMVRPFTDADDTPTFLVTQCFSAEASSLPIQSLRIDYASATIQSANSYKKTFKHKQP